MSNEITLMRLREFMLERAMCYDHFFKESESRSGWLTPGELRRACQESELLFDARETYVAALMVLEEFEQSMRTNKATGSEAGG
ncbi:hypothetical protein DJFAAGMI_04416 [Comamonas sp. PE63]|uniref:Uncharacterized protein n=1 Tax=Comamonas brasiliensis TaxID=1812482 RepID=A0ABS5LYN3_9BURK|nr:hypothetical protein [Comamonas sp. PE63]MBS3021642.1 hypothetical protein [Comamonas sp. PE63]